MAQSTPLGNGSFAQGTRIATPSGPALVESLSPGDQVLTDAGPANLVVAASRPPAPPSVLVRAHAFGQGAPSVDLRLSTEHMIHLRDSGTAEAVLVPVGALINGASIIRLPIVAAVSWITLGVQRHALVLAEDLPVGAMRPDGSPMVARQMPPGPALFALRGRVGRGEIAAVWPAPAWQEPPLAAEPQAAPPVPAARPSPRPAPRPADMPVLALLADGAALPAFDGGTTWRFTIPKGAAELRLVSPVGLPASGDDGRKFGVAVRALVLDSIPLALDGPVAGEGFYGVEGDPRTPGAAWRWTNGNAHLVLPPARRPRRLEIGITDWHTLLKRL